MDDWGNIVAHLKVTLLLAKSVTDAVQLTSSALGAASSAEAPITMASTPITSNRIQIRFVFIFLLLFL